MVIINNKLWKRSLISSTVSLYTCIYTSAYMHTTPLMKTEAMALEEGREGDMGCFEVGEMERKHD